MLWGCVTSKGVGALVPTSETTDTRKYIEILEKYPRPSGSRIKARQWSVAQQIKSTLPRFYIDKLALIYTLTHT